MISVVIPTFNAESGLAATLTSLVPAAVQGLIREAIVVDGGSTDRTLEIADQAGAEIVNAEAGCGLQLQAGAARARSSWLLFLTPESTLEPGWDREAIAFMDGVDRGRRPASAAVFRFAVDDEGFAARMHERVVNISSGLSKLPYGGQGLLISRSLYDEVGGYASLPMMEDRDLARRLGRRRIVTLKSHALTNSTRPRHEGYLRGTLRQQVCLLLYLMRIPVRRIAKLYGLDADAPVRADAAVQAGGSGGRS